MSWRVFPSVSLLLCLSPLVPGQELVKNGDFSGGLTSWTTSGPGLDLKIDTFKTNGVSTDACFALLPGVQGISILGQTLQLPAKARLEVAIDLANAWQDLTTDYAGAVVSVWLGQSKVVEYDFGGAARAPFLRRARAFGVATAGGATELQVRMTSTSPAVFARSPRLLIDNISVRAAPGPVFGFVGERRVGLVAPFSVRTDLPWTAFLVCLSPTLLVPPHKAAGWSGDWHLDPTVLLIIMNSVTDGAGSVAGTLPIPDAAVLEGLPLYWQTLEVSLNGRIFGNATMQGFYGRDCAPQVIEETFADAGRRDAERDGASWASGAAVGRLVGGSGELGDFDVKVGGVDTGLDDGEGRRIWEWDTDKTTIPATRTISGKDVTVTSGVFEFMSFSLKESEHLRFKGSRPPVIKVTGLMKIEGVISQSGLDMARAKSTQQGGPLDGQAGGRSGVGGGRGGKAGDSPKKAAAVINGASGETVAVPSGHPLVGFVAGSGGKGSVANPATGRDQDITFSAYSSTLCQQGASGGAGGGFVTAGVGGKAFDNKKGLQDHPPKPADLGPPSYPGVAVPFDKVINSADPSGLRFQIGGSGGGGSGAHPHGANTFQIAWSSGGGGAGGGGPLQLKVGGELQVAARGRILARGGNSHPQVVYDSVNYYNPAPGGAGAGGTILIQLGGVPTFLGLVDARGGAKGLLDGDGGTLGLRLRVDSESGNGGDGFIRVEANPPIDKRVLGTFLPPAADANTGLLRSVDQDVHTLLATKWYETACQVPRYVRYEIDVTVGTQSVVFSDDPQRGVRAVTGQPVALFVQGVQLDSVSKQPKPNTLTPWHEGIVDPLNVPRPNGFRFLLRFDRTAASNASIVAKRVRFFIQ